MDWFPIRERGVASAALAADGQVTVSDVEVENRLTGAAYSSGALVGLRGWFAVLPAATINGPQTFVAMVLPAGMTVPTVTSAVQLKNQERFIWYVKTVFSVAEVSATSGLYAGDVEIKSSRRFDQGDRLVHVLINDSAVAYGAAAREWVRMDAYVREG